MKLIAIDLDGTLLNSDKQVSLESKQYLTQLKDEGNIIVIATGRNFKSAFLACEGAFFANYIVSSAGAAIYDNMNRRLLMNATISYKTAQSILELYHDNIQQLEFTDLFNHNVFSVDINSSDVREKLNEMHNFLENKNNILHIIISFKDDSTALEVKEYISKKHNDITAYDVHCAYNKKTYIDMVKKGISKYTGICEIAKIHNIENKDIIVFGDSENDIEMIKKSGIGVAMKNSFDVVKENADYITNSNDEDGVLEFLKLYL